MLLTLLSLVLTTASAADLDEDGCEDSFDNANGACVSVDATLASGVTVGASAVVGPYADIGADTALGADTFVGSRSTIVGRVSASGARAVGDGTVIGRSVQIDADHAIGADNTIGRGVMAGERLQTSANVSIGYAAILGDDVTINSGATVGGRVGVGNNTDVLGSAVVARGTTIADSTTAASIGGIVGPNVTIGGDNSIATTARIRKDATLGDEVTVLGGARIARGANIANGVTIGANARIGAGATVTATTIVPDGLVVPRGETYDDPSVGNFAGGTLLNVTEMQQINGWVGDPNANWTLCYKRTVHGTSASAFHSRCDNSGPTVTVSINNGKKFGAYTPLSWISSNSYGNDSTGTSFLFSLTNDFKHVLIGGSWTTNDVYRGVSYGPTFGAGHDFMAYRDGVNGEQYCNPGHTYACRVGTRATSTCSQDFCGGGPGSGSRYTPAEIEVYVLD